MTKGKERGVRSSGKVDPNDEPTRKLPVRGVPMEDDETRPFVPLSRDGQTADARAPGRTPDGDQLEDDDLDEEEDGDLDESPEGEELDDEMEEMEDLEDLEDDDDDDDDEDDDDDDDAKV
jgi:hypothetical protein